MAGGLDAWPVLCGFAGGETGAVVKALLARMPGERRLVSTEAATGCYVTDRRSGERRLLATRLSGAPSRHELDDLVSVTCAAALDSDALVVCNPFPPQTVAPEVIRDARRRCRAPTGRECSSTSPRLGSTRCSRLVLTS